MVRHLVVEGPTAPQDQQRAACFAPSAALVLEQTEENRSSRAYDDMPRMRCRRSLLLLQRARTLSRLRARMFARPWSPPLSKGTAFARLTLSADEIALYEEDIRVLRLRRHADLGSLKASPASLMGACAGARALRARHQRGLPREVARIRALLLPTKPRRCDRKFRKLNSWTRSGFEPVRPAAMRSRASSSPRLMQTCANRSLRARFPPAPAFVPPWNSTKAISPW